MQRVPVPDFARVFDETPTPLLLLTPDLVIVAANRARLEATATTLEATVGRGLFEVFPMNPDDPGADGTATLAESLQRVLATRRPHTMAITKYDIPMPDGTFEERFWSPRNVPILDERGEVALILHRSDDVTGYVRDRDAARLEAARGARWRERAERVESDLFARTRELEALLAELRRSSARAELLARVTEELTETLVAEEAVGRLARLVVPLLGDWCAVSLVDDQDAGPLRRAVRDVGSWHDDPALRPVVDAFVRDRLVAARAGSYVSQALVGGRTVTVTGDATERICAFLGTETAQDLLRQLAPESVTVIPLRGRGRTVGLLSLYNGADRGAITAEDLATASDIAGRAGLALDNARLYREQRRLAAELQRSLLTAPAEPDHVQVVVRYTPAAAAAQVGGDWYDAFLQPAGTTVLVIGDVLGHDIHAAAAMGQVRSLLRGIAVHSGAGPADVLRGVDEAMVTLQVGTTATAVVVRLEQTDDEARRGITQVHWSNAGHPPPMAVNPDGTVVPLVGLSSELLLGLAPDTERTQTEVVLDRGATLLLYTDGLVERRHQSLEDGLLQLRATLEDLAAADLDLDALCDQVLARMLPEHPEDDVALVAVRLHPQDVPRPVEAGPQRVPPDVPDAPEVVPQDR